MDGARFDPAKGFLEKDGQSSSRFRVQLHLLSERQRFNYVATLILSENFGIGLVEACQQWASSAFWGSAMSESSDAHSDTAPARPAKRRERTAEQINQSAADQALMRQLQNGDESAFAS
ncbi:MAG: hypothetical protein ABIY47_03535, partial [Opitutaceae bacterium]